MNTRRRRAVFALSILLAFGTVGSTPVGSVEAPEAGWWWRTQTGVGQPIPPPPTVPANGLMVSGTPEGATAVAAVRYLLEETETSPVLTLRISNEAGAATALVGACPAGSAWIPAHGGRWDTAPTAACELGSVNGVLSDDRKSMTFALSALVVSSVVDVVLVPGKVSGAPRGADGSAFQISFEPPDESSLAVTPADPDEETSDAGFAFDPGFGAAPETFLSDTGFAPPVAFSPALEPQQQVVTPSAPINQRVASAQLPRRAEEAGGNLLGFLVAAAGLYALMRATKGTPPPVRRLGPMAHRPVPVLAAVEAEPAGLGRFARPRVGSAPRLH